MIDTITTTLELAEQPMRTRDIHATAEQLLDRPIKWTSVRSTLAEHPFGPRPRFQRPGYERIASRGRGLTKLIEDRNLDISSETVGSFWTLRP